MNPLNSIINFTEYMKEKTKMYLEYSSCDSVSESSSSCEISEGNSFEKSESTVKILGRDLKNQYKLLNIVLNSSSLVNLLNLAILNINKIQQGKFTPEFEHVSDPFAILRRFLKYFKENIQQKKLTLVVDEDISGD